MIDKEAVFVKKSNTQFLLFDAGNILTIKCSKSNDVVREAQNAIKSSDFKQSNLSSLTKNIFKYIGLSIVSKNKVKQISLNNYVVIEDKTPQELIEIGKEIGKTKRGYIVNLHGYVLIVPVGLSICLYCLIKRFLFSQYSIYKYSELWSEKPLNISDIDGLSEKILSVVQPEIDKKIFLVNKSTFTVDTAELISFSDCPVCYPNLKHDTSVLELKSHKIFTNDNGTRVIDTKEALKIFKRCVGRLKPVLSYKVDNDTDFLGLPVSESSINIDPLNFDFGYRVHGGKGQEKVQAICSSIGEAMERYNAQYFSNEVTRYDSFNNMIKNNTPCINPKSFQLYPGTKYKYDENLKLEWNLVTRLSDNEKVWVPANFVYFVYKPVEAKQDFIPQDTTGLSSGITIEEAVLQGIQEVIERDAYSIYFRKQLNCQDIDINTIEDKSISNLIRRLKNNGIIVHLKYLKTDVSSYVVHCITEDTKHRFPVYTHGAGSSLNPYIAISRAITECIQLRVSQIKIGNDINQFDDQKEYEAYISWGNGKEDQIGTLLNSWNKISCKKMPILSSNDILQDINFLIKNIKELGYEIYVANLSRRDTPIKTVRVLIPGMQPADETNKRITKRMGNVPKFLNQETKNALFEKTLFS